MALNISRGVVFKAQKIVIYGPEGIGKSTFASQFPDPVFIDTEGSTNHMDVGRLPRPTSWTMMLNMIKEIAGTPGCCKTLVIDTIDWAEQLCVKHLCGIYDKKGIEDFGYGKGYIFLKEEFGRLLNLLTDLTEIGINVVLTAHSTIRKFELPDECGSYDRYELKLGNKTGSQTSALVKEWADMVLFANYKQYVVEVDKKKKGQGGTRIMYTQHHPCWDAKNRHDLKAELPFEYMQIAYCIPNHSDSEPGPIKVEQSSTVASSTTPAVDPSKERPNIKYTGEICSVCGLPQFDCPSGITCTNGHGGAPAVEQSQAKEKKTSLGNLQGLPKSLTDLMTANQVTVEEIQNVVSMKGYYPQDTPLKNYDQGFIDGVLVGAWDQVFAMIKEARLIPFR